MNANEIRSRLPELVAGVTNPYKFTAMNWYKKPEHVEFYEALQAMGGEGVALVTNLLTADGAAESDRKLLVGALAILVTLEAVEASAPARAYLEHADPYVQQQAWQTVAGLEAYRLIRDERGDLAAHVKRLIQVRASDAPVEARWAAEDKLKEMGAAINPVLVEVYAQANPAEQQKIIDQLALYPDEVALPILRRAYEDHPDLESVRVYGVMVKALPPEEFAVWDAARQQAVQRVKA
ncbi:MAG: hypothetical protein JW910_09610 [Anaerolineae bacterium]|nr:hypothetical protein [Anaerolineae bacterium]